MKEKHRWSLAVSLVFYVFAVMAAAMMLAGFIMVILNHKGILNWNHEMMGTEFRPPVAALVGMILFSVIIGTALASFFSRRALKPIRKLVEATRKVARGDFNVFVESEGSIRELDELHHSFNQMTRELSSTQTLRNDFINNFSHEFKTPIVSIRGFAKLLKEGGLSEDERNEYLGIIVAESQRLSTLATNVLNLSKYESMEIIAEKETFRVDEQLRRVIAMTEPQWAAKGITVDVALDETEYYGNPDLIQQIWLNLIDNAIKFSHTGGNFGAICAEVNGAVIVTIKDDGIGMDEAVRLRIFDKFFQGDASHKQTGNGLGLTMAKRIAELHGGTIRADSQPGRGSSFMVMLPK
ncbi:MAG: HAMP domain-containing histidine kinase [Defluviitaleaceae bacterium]|nr:HAMP domain-containing histidine kinase [Defluviitaleaceae bacterium]